MGHIAEKEYSIHYYEIDYKKRCLITSLLNYLQDLAILQSDRLGAGIDYLDEHKMAWVLYRWDVKINQYPMYREKIRIRTNPCSFVKFYAYRTFEITGENGEIIASAGTVWLLVNTENKKPVKINEHMYQAYGVSTDENTPLEFEDLEDLAVAADSLLPEEGGAGRGKPDEKSDDKHRNGADHQRDERHRQAKGTPLQGEHPGAGGRIVETELVGDAVSAARRAATARRKGISGARPATTNRQNQTSRGQGPGGRYIG